MPNVAYIRPEVSVMMPRWQLIRDVLSGEQAVKEKRETYLPRPNPTDKSKENRLRYDDYLKRAVFYGVTSRTLRGMTGEVFQRDPVTTLPESMSVLETDADGAGVNLDQVARKTLSEVLAYGRIGVMVDYPPTQGGASKADLQRGNLRPTINLYPAWDVINWRVDLVGAQKKLTLVVIADLQLVEDDGFEKKYQNIFRVLWIDPATGNYTVTIYIKATNQDLGQGQGPYIVDSTYVPLDASGQPWKEIPFTFIGSENNDTAVDLPPLYDMAVINIAHYRNSADYEESVYLVGQPTPVITGLNQQWVNEVLKNQISFGSQAAIQLPVGANAELLQAEPNSMVREAMQDKEAQLIKLGARLIEPGTIQKTATQSMLDESSTVSVLGVCAKNVSHGITKCLKWCAVFMGVPVPDESTEDNQAESDEGSKDDICYDLNSEFDFMDLSPQSLQQIIAAWQSKGITTTEMRDNLTRAGIAYQSMNDYQDEIDSEPLTAPALPAAMTKIIAKPGLPQTPSNSSQ